MKRNSQKAHSGPHYAAPYKGPAKPVPTRSWRAAIADKLSAFGLEIIYLLAIVIVLLDVFVWRIQP